MKKFLITTAVAISSFAGASFAEVETGFVEAITDDATVVAVRDERTLALSTGDSLSSGDVLLIGGEGSAFVSFAGCSRDIPSGSSITLNKEFCFDASGRSSTSQLNLDGGPATLTIAALAAAGAVAGIIVATTDDDDDDDDPVSP